MYTIYWLKSINGIKLRLKRSVRTAGSVKLEELRREVAESLASLRQGGSRCMKLGFARLVKGLFIFYDVGGGGGLVEFFEVSLESCMTPPSN